MVQRVDFLSVHFFPEFDSSTLRHESDGEVP